MEKARILLLITSYSPVFSGHGVYLQALMPLIEKRGYRFDVLTGDFGKYPQLEWIDGVRVRRVPFDPQESRWEIKFTAKILQFLLRRRWEFDILHVNGHMDYYGLLTMLCRALGKRIVMQMVLLGSDDPVSLRSQYRCMSLRLRILSQMDRFIHISTRIGESCRRAGLPAWKLRYIPQGVDTEKFSPADQQQKGRIRSRLGLACGGPVVSFVGAIIHRKGVDMLVDAWRAVQREFPQSQLVLIGPCEFGEEDVNRCALNVFVDELRTQISQHALNVRMVGQSSDVASFLQASDLFVLPSRSEGFGNVILEAMSCAVPPVVTFMDGVSLDSVTPGRTGVIVRSRDDLAGAIVALLRDDQRRRDMGAAAREDVVRRFALGHIADKYAAVYDELSGGTGPRGPRI